jgi:hypothetical protein
MQQLEYNSGRAVFLRGPCREVWSLVDRSLRESVKTGLEPEAEEYPLLETENTRLCVLLNCKVWK